MNDEVINDSHWWMTDEVMNGWWCDDDWWWLMIAWWLILMTDDDWWWRWFDYLCLSTRNSLRSSRHRHRALRIVLQHPRFSVAEAESHRVAALASSGHQTRVSTAWFIAGIEGKRMFLSRAAAIVGLVSPLGVKVPGLFSRSLYWNFMTLCDCPTNGKI